MNFHILVGIVQFYRTHYPRDREIIKTLEDMNILDNIFLVLNLKV